MNTIVPQAARQVKGGRPLAERVAEAVESYAFAFEFDDGAGADVFGCYKADDLSQPAYALEVRGGQIVSCNCPDAQCRKRTCKHQILLCLSTGYGIQSPGLPPVAVAAMNTVFHAPRPVSAGLLAGDFMTAAPAPLSVACPPPAPAPDGSARRTVSGFDPSDWR